MLGFFLCKKIILQNHIEQTNIYYIYDLERSFFMRKNRLTALLLATAIGLSSFAGVASTATPVYAATAYSNDIEYGHNGFYCNKNHTDRSDRLIIGDSRNCQMWNYDHTGASFVSTWGGGYGGDISDNYKNYKGATVEASINYTKKVARMKEIAQKSIKQNGSCKIFLFSTVNAYDGGSSYNTPVKKIWGMTKLAKTWKAEYKGKTVAPTIYVMSLVGSKGKNVSNYNKALKALCDADSKVTYVNISSCVGSSGYQKDNVHYTNATLKNLWTKVKSFK